MHGIVECRLLPRLNVVFHNGRRIKPKFIDPPHDSYLLQTSLGYFLARVTPPTKFHGNNYSNVCAVLQANKQTE